MKIVLIGAGNVAWHLAQQLVRVGHEVVQVYSRTETSARTLAECVGAEGITDLQKVTNEADGYVFSVKDEVLPELIRELSVGRREKLMIHTAGSVSMEVFEAYGSRYGVIYPMQTFSKKRMVDFSHIPLFVEGCNDATENVLLSLAHDLSNSVRVLSSAERKKLHLAAVFACNFTNHCYALAAEILKDTGIAFDSLLPLIDETARKVHELNPCEAQTGPAVRQDTTVMGQQEALLNDEGVKRLYRVMSADIYRMTKDKE